MGYVNSLERNERSGVDEGGAARDSGVGIRG